MKSAILFAVATASLCAAAPVLAQEAEAAHEGPIEIIRATDSALTCPAMADEAAQLSQTMGGEPGGGLFDRLGGVARAGAAMVIPGAGLAIAGADALTAPERERKAAEAAAIQHRWYYLNGLYAGRGCMNAAPVAPATPAVPGS
jgi:hypothetical protein